MNRGERRRRTAKIAAEGYMPFKEMAGRLAAHVLDAGGTTVCIGPLVCRSDDDPETPDWYFVVCSGGPNFTNTFRADRVGAPDKDTLAKARDVFYGALCGRRRIVIHLFEDELEMCRWCETIWPGDRIRKIRSNIEAERAAEGHA